MDAYTSAFVFGAVGDGVTDDTVAVQAAHDAGVRLKEPSDAVFLVSDLAAKVSVSGGTYKRKAGETGDFITVDASGVVLDCAIDQNSVGLSTDRAVFADGTEGFRTGPNFEVMNTTGEGVHVRNLPAYRFEGGATDTVGTALFTYNDTADITSMQFAFTVDSSALGTANTGGGVKCHLAAGATNLASPSGTIDVVLAQSTAMPSDSVCVEFFGVNAASPNYVSGPESFWGSLAGLTIATEGGRIGVTRHGCNGAGPVAVVTGPAFMGLESTASSAAGGYAPGSAVVSDTVSPTFAVVVAGGSDGATIYADVGDVDDALDTEAASYYVDGSSDVTIYGTTAQNGGKHVFRLKDAANFTGEATHTGSGVAAVVTLASGDCSGLLIDGGAYNTTRPIAAYGTHDDATFTDITFNNVSAFLIAGSPVLTNFTATGCTFTAQPYSGVTRLDISNWKADPTLSVIDADRNGTPAPFINPGVGSVCKDTTTNIIYDKTGATSADWVAR